MTKLVVIVCLATLSGLAIVWVSAYLSARCERKLQEEETEDHRLRVLLAQKALTYPQAPDPIEQVVDLQWLQQRGFDGISVNRWVN